MYKYKNDGFSVAFPCDPRFIDSSDKLTSVHLYSATDINGIVYQVCKADYQLNCSMLSRPKRSSLIILAQQLMYNELVNDEDDRDFVLWKKHRVIRYFALRKKGEDYKGDGSYKDCGMLKDKRNYIKGLIILFGSTAYTLNVCGVENNIDDNNYNNFIESFNIPTINRYALLLKHLIRKKINLSLNVVRDPEQN